MGRLLRLQHTQTLHTSVKLSVFNTTSNMAVSKIRQNYHEECEALINKQINMEFYASYVYLSMASYFARDDVALHGFAGHFKTESGEERNHGIKLMDYQNSRGGKVVFQDIQKPSSMEWGSPLDAKGDAHLCDFLEAEYLGEQVDGIKSIGNWITKIKRAGDGLGVHIIDKEIGS